MELEAVKEELDDETLKDKAPEEGSELTYSQEYYILKREEIL